MVLSLYRALAFFILDHCGETVNSGNVFAVNCWLRGYDHHDEGVL